LPSSASGTFIRAIRGAHPSGGVAVQIGILPIGLPQAGEGTALE